MTKKIGVVLVFTLLVGGVVFTACATNLRWRVDTGVIPFEYWSKNEGERLVFLAPVLAPNQQASWLYVITNPEDVQNAADKWGNRDRASGQDINKALKEFSPIMIGSEANTNILGMGSQKLGNGLAVFSVPPSVDKFFYIYLKYKEDDKYSNGYTTDVWYNILALPPGSEDVFIGFSEDEDGLVLSAKTDPAEMKTIYDATTGYYGGYFLSSKKEQVGYMPLGFKQAFAVVREKQKAEALAAGGRVFIRSDYYTYRQEMREYQAYKAGKRHWEQGTTTNFYDSHGSKIGSSETQSKIVVDPGHYESETVPVTISTKHELAFELYKGDVKVYSGSTPAVITGIVVDEEYTLRWGSPENGIRERQFSVGLDWFGFPDLLCFLYIK